MKASIREKYAILSSKPFNSHPFLNFLYFVFGLTIGIVIWLNFKKVPPSLKLYILPSPRSLNCSTTVLLAAQKPFLMHNMTDQELLRWYQRFKEAKYCRKWRFCSWLGELSTLVPYGRSSLRDIKDFTPFSCINIRSMLNMFVRILSSIKGESRVSDEHYLPTLVQMHYGQFSANRSITYVDWSRGGPQPREFDWGDISDIEFLSHIKHGTNCIYNGYSTNMCFLFAIRFHPNALESLLRLAPLVLGFGH